MPNEPVLPKKRGRKVNPEWREALDFARRVPPKYGAKWPRCPDSQCCGKTQFCRFTHSVQKLRIGFSVRHEENGAVVIRRPSPFVLTGNR